MPCASAWVMYSGLSPSIEIISTGAACAAASAKIEVMTKQEKTEKRRTAVFIESAPQEILLGANGPAAILGAQANGIPSAGEVYRNRESEIVNCRQRAAVSGRR